MQELYQERPDSTGSKNENETGDLACLAVGEAQKLSQVNQNPFTMRRGMMSVVNAWQRGEGGSLATAGSKRSVPWLVIEILPVAEPVPHGVDIKPDLSWAEEPEGLAAISQDHQFRCSARKTSDSCGTREG